jgi:hypothetical protein
MNIEVRTYVHCQRSHLFHGGGQMSGWGRNITGGTGGDGGSEGGAHHRGGIETAAVEGGRSAGPDQGGCGESGVGSAVAGGDDADGGLDRGAIGDGHARACEPPAVSAAEVRRQVAIIKN